MGTATGSEAPAGTLQELADYLREGFWSESGTVPRKYNLGSAGPNPNAGVLEYNLSGFANKLGITDTDGILSPRKDLVRDAFDLFEEVLGINFVESSNSDADFFFSDNETGAFSASAGYSAGIEYSVINVNASWSGGTSHYDDYTLQTIFHEIGHALGLGHQGFYNGSGDFGTSAQFSNDSWQASMMSYFSQTQNTTVAASFEFLQTPMSVDWLALDDIYGDDSYGGQAYGVQNAFLGDTVYGFNTNITPAVSEIWARYKDYGFRTASTLVDAGGIDTLDLSGYASDQSINLTPSDPDATAPTVMNVGGRIGNLTLAVGTVIENAKGGAGNDDFIGNDADNSFWGNGGNDTFTDSIGSDTYHGGGGTDRVNFGARFIDYTFELVGSFLNVISKMPGLVVDFVSNSVERLGFSDQTQSFSSIVSGLSAPLPTATIASVSDDEGTITGNIGNGGATNDATPLLAGTLSAALSTSQSVAVFRDSAKIGEADVSGLSWNYTDSGIGDGTHVYRVAVEDGAETGELSDSHTIQLDTTAPVVSVNSVVSDSMSPALSGTVDDVNASIVATVDGRQYTAVNDGGGTWSLAAGQVATLAAGTYDVSVKATDTVGNVGIDSTNDELVIESVPQKIEFGNAVIEQRNATSWYPVSFSETIPDAIVVMGPISFNGGQAATPRVRNVTDVGFEFQVDEWDYRDGYHVAETIGWMAASAGSYEVGGLGIQAGTAVANNETWQGVSLGQGFAASPMIITQVASDNDAAAVVTRVRNVDADSFVFQMQEEELADGVHAEEEIHWIALEIGDGTAFDVGVTPDKVTHRDYTIGYDAVAEAEAVFLAGMQTRDGADTANLRVKSVGATSATLFVDEEQSRDPEVNHITEVVGYLITEEALWYT